jgi:hypothetical protein
VAVVEKSKNMGRMLPAILLFVLPKLAKYLASRPKVVAPRFAKSGSPSFLCLLGPKLGSGRSTDGTRRAALGLTLLQLS